MNSVTLATLLQGRDTTTGAATIEIMGALGAMFTICQPVTTDTKGKEAIGLDWRDRPRDTDRATRHIRANKGRNNVGILTGAGGWVSFDCDRMAVEFLTGAGLDDGLIVHRANAGDRCKVLLVCPDPDNLPDRVTVISATDGGGNFLESSGRRSNVIVAGTHHTGAAVVMTEGRVIVRSAAQINQMVDDYRAWLTDKGHPVAADPPQSPRLVSSKPNPTQTTHKAVSPTGWRVDWAQLTHEAIEWNIAQGVYRTDSTRMLASCKRAGGAWALRSGESVPSTRRTDIRDQFHKVTYRDFGTNETRDEFELAVMATGRNRRELVNEAIDEYLQATQGRTLADVRNELAVFAQRKQQRVERDAMLMAGR